MRLPYHIIHLLDGHRCDRLAGGLVHPRHQITRVIERIPDRRYLTGRDHVLVELRGRNGCHLLVIGVDVEGRVQREALGEQATCKLTLHGLVEVFDDVILVELASIELRKQSLDVFVGAPDDMIMIRNVRLWIFGSSL